MIVDERSFCIYCRDELLTQHEITNEYHDSCHEELIAETSDFDLYDIAIVNDFEKKIEKRKVKYIIFLILFSIPWFILTISLKSPEQNNYILLIWVVWFFGILYFLFHYSKLRRLSYFCRIAKNIMPYSIYLSDDYCIALLGTIKVILKSSRLYLIKFLNYDKVESKKLMLPSFKNKNSSDSNIGIKFRKMRENCQVPYNKNRSISGMAVIYLLQFKEIKDMRSLSNLIYIMNKETIKFNIPYPKQPRLATFLITLGGVIIMVIAISLKDVLAYDFPQVNSLVFLVILIVFLIIIINKMTKFIKNYKKL